ncbi:hypothetical protein [Actinomadura rugatobispora]|uniref:Cold-shock protein n=1 Tax=Actinomadura rugatobispora TaxID=1994 RepID=A0ABW1AAM2_9ACTN|nr:hypothetical protein GCM10010200_066530 [Actinomadura rugatobispora]
MQATVRHFDAGTRSGSVLLDDGTELPFDTEAFDAGGLRLLRLGQRVNIAVEGAAGDASGAGPGRITVITLSTFPLP